MTTLTSFGGCSSEYEGRDKNGITHLGVSKFCARVSVPCFFLYFFCFLADICKSYLNENEIKE